LTLPSSICPPQRFTPKPAARRAAQAIIDEFNAVPEATRAEKRRFNELIDRYLLEELPRRHSSKKGYRAIIENQIWPRWGNEFLDDVKPMAVRGWLKSLDCSTRYRGHIHGMMRILFRFAMLWEWVPAGENPMSLFRTEGSTKRRKQPAVLTGEQFSAFLAEITQPIYRTMVFLAICLGISCSELFALKWCDVFGPDLRGGRYASTASIFPRMLRSWGVNCA
jgi:integrase